MKKFFPSAVIAGLLGFASLNALAVDGTITINGTVTDSTCSVNGNVPGAKPLKTVTLPTVQDTELATAGATAGVTNAGDIQFVLTNCSAATTKAVAKFENTGAYVDQATGNLSNLADVPANNVLVQLLNAKMAPIDVRTNTNNQLAVDGADVSSGNGTIQYYARYFATGKAVAGDVESHVTYSMQYQ